MVGGADSQSRFGVRIQTANGNAGHTAMIALIPLMASLAGTSSPAPSPQHRVPRRAAQRAVEGHRVTAAVLAADLADGAVRERRVGIATDSAKPSAMTSFISAILTGRGRLLRKMPFNSWMDLGFEALRFLRGPVVLVFAPGCGILTPR
jgi:hypothetical protein